MQTLARVRCLTSGAAACSLNLRQPWHAEAKTSCSGSPIIAAIIVVRSKSICKSCTNREHLFKNKAKLSTVEFAGPSYAALIQASLQADNACVKTNVNLQHASVNCLFMQE